MSVKVRISRCDTPDLIAIRGIGVDGLEKVCKALEVSPTSVDSIATRGALSVNRLNSSALDAEVDIIFLLVSPPNRPSEHLRGLEAITRHLESDDFNRFLQQSMSSIDAWHGCVIQAVGHGISDRATVPERVLEEFDGVVDEIRNGTAYVTLTAKDGEEFLGEYNAIELAEFGVAAHSRFRCQTVESESQDVHVRFIPIPLRPLTSEEEFAIDQEIDELLDGGEFDGHQ